MTIQTDFFDWSRSGLPWNASPWESDSPNLTAILAHLIATWGGRSVGIHHDKMIGKRPSTHAYGAALDWRWGEAINRRRLVDETIPFLIDNSLELGVQAIHDYVANRIWRPPGTSGRPADGDGWRDQGNSSDTSMGNPGSVWLHIETTRDRWGDATPVGQRLVPARRVDMLDISSWQTITKYADMPDVPIVHRVITNDGTVDSRFGSRIGAIEKHHQIFGGYAVLTGGIGHVDRQMSDYIERMDPVWRAGAFTQLDVEPWSGFETITIDGLTRAIHVHDAAFGPGRVCVYLNPYVLPKLWDQFVAAHPDVARWVPGYRSDDNVKAATYGATIHQWTDKHEATGFTGPVDANEVRDWATLHALAGLGEQETIMESLYFKTSASRTATWVAYPPMRVAFHVQLPAWDKAVVDGLVRAGDVVTLTDEQAARYVYVPTLPHDVAGLSPSGK